MSCAYFLLTFLSEGPASLEIERRPSRSAVSAVLQMPHQGGCTKCAAAQSVVVESPCPPRSRHREAATASLSDRSIPAIDCYMASSMEADMHVNTSMPSSMEELRPGTFAAKIDRKSPEKHWNRPMSLLKKSPKKSPPDMFLAEEPPSLVADAYKALKTAIRDNVFAPGDQGSEQEIALRLGMSRTPVHEALIRLQAEGLVRIVPKRGIVVLGLSPADMREVYDVIVALESMAAETIAALPDASRRQIAAELSSINAEMKLALQREDLNAWAYADDRFHRALIDRCGNTRLARMAHSIMDQSHRARMMTLRLRGKLMKSVNEHQSIVTAIRNGKAALAGERAKGHRMRARNELLPLLDQFGMKNL